MDWDTLLRLAKVIKADEEGWVVKTSDEQRFKIKGDAYLLAHRVMTGATFGRVLDAVAQGKYEDMIAGVPDEFLAEVKSYRYDIERECVAIESQVDLNLMLAPDGDRREFALWVQANYPKSEWAYFFARKDGKDIRPIIYKNAFKNRKEE